MKTVLVLGATGGIGGEMARNLAARGWQVKGMARQPERAPRIDGVQWVAGDAMQGADVMAAAEGADVIVHAVNPPGYRDWDKLVLPMLDNSIAAARAHDARIVLPGTIYNFGSGTQEVLREDTPQQPSSRKGAIRVQMEARLRDSGVRTLIVRGGDFFGPRNSQNWFSGCMVKPGQPVDVVTQPFEPGVGHTWAYLPDLAETMARLLEREGQLDRFDVFHFRGHWDADGEAMMQAVLRVAARAGAVRKVFPWKWLRLLSPFVAFLREAGEMRYLAHEPYRLDNSKLLRVLGTEPHTPLDQAIGASLRGLGCV